MSRRQRAKKGALRPGSGARPRRTTSKWHIAVDTFGRPVHFILTGGNISDAKLAIPLLTGLDARHVLADKAYDGHAILNHVEASGARPIIPRRICMPRRREFDPAVYKLRHRIERTIGKLKQLRRVATRYDRLPHDYLATLYLAAIAFRC